MRITHLRYDARFGKFEASVDIQRNGRTYRYPCEVTGPQSMEPATVAAHLAQRALNMSDTIHR